MRKGVNVQWCKNPPIFFLENRFSKKHFSTMKDIFKKILRVFIKCRKSNNIRNSHFYTFAILNPVIIQKSFNPFPHFVETIIHIVIFMTLRCKKFYSL